MSQLQYYSSETLLGDRNWPTISTSTAAVASPSVVVCRQLVESPMDIIADTTGDLSWAYSQEFEAKLDEALRDIEGGSLESVETIDQLIEYIDVQRQSAQEES